MNFELCKGHHMWFHCCFNVIIKIVRKKEQSSVAIVRWKFSSNNEYIWSHGTSIDRNWSTRILVLCYSTCSTFHQMWNLNWLWAEHSWIVVIDQTSYIFLHLTDGLVVTHWQSQHNVSFSHVSYSSLPWCRVLAIGIHSNSAEHT